VEGGSVNIVDLVSSRTTEFKIYIDARFGKQHRQSHSCTLEARFKLRSLTRPACGLTPCSCADVDLLSCSCLFLAASNSTKLSCAEHERSRFSQIVVRGAQHR
jgi:hypothetical protein